MGDLSKAKREAFKVSHCKVSNRDKANAFRSVALLAIELEDYDVAIEYGEYALSFCEDKYIQDIQVINSYVIDKALALKGWE